MHLVSVDLDPNPRLFGMHLGPFSTGLNAICGPRGTGKTSLLTMARRLLFGQPTFSNATYLDAADRISMGERWLNDHEYCMGSVHAETKRGIIESRLRLHRKCSEVERSNFAQRTAMRKFVAIQ